MLGQSIPAILAQTDPFDLAQGVERYIRSLTGEQVRYVISAARSQMNEGYRAEFLPLLDEQNDERLKAAFAHSLKSNLRAIPLFGPAFSEGVIEQTPGDRAIGLGEEGHDFRALRPAAIGVIALALLIGGAAAEHVWNAAKATAQTPVVLFTPPPTVAPMPSPVAAATPQPAKTTATPAKRIARAPVKPAPQRPAPVMRVAAAAPVARPVTHSIVPPVTAAPVTAPPAAPPARVATKPHLSKPRLARTVPAGRGVKTVVAAPIEHTPMPAPIDQGISDMPRSYTDATPLPQNATPPPVAVSTNTAGFSAATPTPGPNRSWTHRLVHAGVHLVNSTLTTIGISKRPGTPTPSPSPSGPHPQ